MSEIATTMSSEAEASSNKSALVATASEELSAGAATVASGIGPIGLQSVRRCLCHRADEFDRGRDRR